ILALASRFLLYRPALGLITAWFLLLLVLGACLFKPRKPAAQSRVENEAPVLTPQSGHCGSGHYD
ncbi:MAG TPA: hypothetical protein VH744_14010, partial [Terriglobales bacterium]